MILFLICALQSMGYLLTHGIILLTLFVWTTVAYLLLDRLP